MKIFLAGTASHRNVVEPNPPKYILESFYYVQDWQLPIIKNADDFLLDSGAFTFMGNSKKTIVWEEYIEQFADFINRNKIEKFFELDIDSIVGYDKVLQYRKRLEQLTNKPVIPVWHINRGIDEFKKMCIEYSYVAIGGIVGLAKNRTKFNQYRSLFPKFIDYAHKCGAKIHGLGFTSTSLFHEIVFDSVDSTTWTFGGRMGNLCYFDGTGGMRQYYPSSHGKKPIDTAELAKINYAEWLKFQKYAEKNL